MHVRLYINCLLEYCRFELRAAVDIRDAGKFERCGGGDGGGGVAAHGGHDGEGSQPGGASEAIRSTRLHGNFLRWSFPSLSRLSQVLV